MSLKRPETPISSGQCSSRGRRARSTRVSSSSASRSFKVPLDRPLDDAQSTELATAGTIVVPTTTTKGIAEGLKTAGAPGAAYVPSRASVSVLHDAGMPILAGTDANAVPFGPSSPPFGESLHLELALLVEAGLSPADALNAATSGAAEHCGLDDRGRIEPSLRADFVLLDADPLLDFSARLDRGTAHLTERLDP